MSNDDRRRQFWISEIEAVRKRGSDAHIAFRNLSAAFSQLAVRSAFIINGGAMFAGLAFLGALSRASAENGYWGGFIAAWVCFSAGIVCAALCAMVAYFNYESHALRELSDTEMEAMTTSAGYFPDFYSDKQDQIQRNKDHWNAEIAKHDQIINKTQRIAVGLGIASYTLFIIGCTVVGVTMATA